LSAIVDNTREARHLTLADRICEAMKQDIVSGRLAQGAKLNEPLLARSYGISRGPLREAIRRLEGLGLVRHVPHAGARVVSHSVEELVEIYRVREALEGMAARLAASLITAGEVAELYRLLDSHEHHVTASDGQTYALQEGDFDFHFRVIQAARNHKLTHILQGDLYHPLRMYRYQASQHARRPQRALLEHRRIVDALADGDGELAELLMRRHIEGARMALAEHIHAREPAVRDAAGQEERER
jgi:DNA-binding GntR family transcriptional regulator